MNRRQFLGTAAAAPFALSAAKERPNILVILADDLGWSDIGCYGGEIQTPNIDKLAGGGVRFTQFYNVARCCPSRASIMTGLHPHQVGMGNMTAPKPRTDFPGHLFGCISAYGARWTFCVLAGRRSLTHHSC